MKGEQNFWSRRRAGVQAEAEADQIELEAQVVADEQAELEEKTDEEILAELDLPDPDSMKEGDDFTVFMSNAVPDRIRNRALRTLWRSNPVLANVDMLVDYGEDFTDAAMAVENIQTAYQVGKGMLKHVQEMARQAEERENPPAPEELEDEPEEEKVILSEVENEIEPIPFEDTDEEVQNANEAPTPRRMKFRVKETA